MKIMARRAVIAAIFLLAFAGGMAYLIVTYLANAPAWAAYPADKHLYTNGQPKVGTVYDRNGVVLAQTIDGKRVYNDDKTIRTALMQAVGDSGGNVATGAQVAFAAKLGGWNLLGGAFSLNENGGTVKLTLDAQLCATAYTALAGRRGAVGVMNYKTGEILCMASSPSFDPQNPPDVRADPEAYKGVYLNRLLSGAYTPGSVFKLVTAAAALDNIPDIGTRSFTCTGVLNTGGYRVTCPEEHGKVNFAQALADSCNVTFGQLALELGGPTLQKYAEKAGFNQSLSVDGIRTAKGRAELKNAKGPDLAWAGVGQSADTANPLAMMAYAAAIANGGVRVSPRLLAGSSAASERILSENTAKTLGQMMRNDVVSNYGDGNFKGLSLCAKSGTAQLSDGEQPHAWFVGFMNRQDCPLAFVVVVENGGGGSAVAGPVAGRVLQAAAAKAAR